MNIRLREIRKKKGYSLKKLGKMTGIALSTIGNYETGRYSISQEFLSRIAKELDVTVQEIMPHAEDKKEKFSVADHQPEWHINGTRRRVVEQPPDEKLYRHFTLEWLRGAFAAATAAGDVASAAYLGSLIVEREKEGTTHE